jgi:DNA-binding transcriptional MerR regulator
MKKYTVAGLAKLAGVTVRTLHVYDQIGLLKPAIRSEAGYRYYSEPELLRLQQILFFKEMGISLEEIGNILDDPDFDLEEALEGHKQSLERRKEQIETMLNTLTKTIINLKEKNMLKHEELYEGLSKEQAGLYRKEAVAQYGAHAIERAEFSLKNRSKEELAFLKKEQKEIAEHLFSLMGTTPDSKEVQTTIERHYNNIRKFWGTHGDKDPQKEAYMGLADLYLTDERFLQTHGEPQPQLALFIKRAIHFFASHKLK